MNIQQRIIKNVGVLVLGNIIHKIFTLVLFVYIARYLGDVGFGQYTFVIAFVNLFQIIIAFGFDLIIQREVARDKTQTSKYISNVVFMRLFFFIVAFVLIVISINLLNYPKDITNLVYLYSFFLLFHYLSQGFRSVFFGYEKMEYEFIIVVANRLFLVPLSILALIQGYSVLGLIIVLIASEFLNLIISFFIFSKRIETPKFEIDLEVCRSLIQKASPFIFLSVFLSVYHNIDTVMLSKMQGDAATGLYNSAYRLLTSLLIIPFAFMGSVFPVMSRFYKESKDNLKQTFSHALRYLIIIALPIAMGTFLLSDRIIVRVYGGGFIEASIALQILVWGTALNFLNSALFNVLISMNKEKILTRILVSGIILNVILNYALIPKYSFAGASFATVASEAFFVVWAFYVVSKSLHYFSIHKLTLKPIVASLAMAAFILYFREIITLFVIIPLAAVLYFAALIILKEFSEEDSKLIRKVLNR
jgi:O-antigen/teichoic acid export membrane protein